MAMKKNGIANIIAGVLVGCFAFGGAFGAIKTESAQAATATNDTLVSTYVSENVKIKNAPSVVCEVDSQSVLDKLKSAVENDTEKSASAIVNFNENGKIIDGAGVELGDFQTVFNETFAGEIIPVVRVETEAAANAFVSFLTDTLDILDIAVMSSNPALVKKVRTAKPTVRGIISYTEKTELADMVTSANEHLASTVVLPASKATTENVRYLQARMKSVWVVAESTEKMHLNDCIQSGAYGVVATDYQSIYSAYETYGESLCRTPFNILNQGVKNLHNENSKLGTQKAIEYGASAVRLDARLSKDNEIILMYDATIDRTTNGAGMVNSFTLEELRSFQLDLIDYEKETIPTLNDVIPLFEETDAVLWLELKENDHSLVTALRESLEEYDFFENIVVQASDGMISAVQEEIPEISTVITRKIESNAYTQLAKDFATYNSHILHDMKNGYTVTVSSQSFLKDRGICAIFQGTPSALNDDVAMNTRTQEGVMGFLGNEGAYYRKREMIVQGKTDTRPALELNDEVSLTVKNYDGSVTEETGNVFALEDKGDHWLVVAVYEGKLEIPLYTQSFTVVKGEKEESASTPADEDTPDKEQKENNAVVWIIVSAVAVALVAGGIAAVIIVKKRNKQE